MAETKQRAILRCKAELANRRKDLTIQQSQLAGLELQVLELPERIEQLNEKTIPDLQGKVDEAEKMLAQLESMPEDE